MGSYALSRMDIDPGVLRKLNSRGIRSAQDVFSCTTLDLLEKLEDVSMTEIEKLVGIVSAYVAPKPTTVREMVLRASSEVRCLPTSVQGIDSALRGGMPCGAITELVGAAGVGKTQMCFMLTMLAAISPEMGGRGQSVIYIDTEKKFTSQRIVQMIRCRIERTTRNLEAVNALIESILDRIIVLMPNDPKEVLDQLRGLEFQIMVQDVCLVVVDSIAALVRAAYGKDQIIERQAMLAQQAAQLKRLAETSNLPVVVTNQVMAKFGQNVGQRTGASSTAIQEPLEDVTPALGVKWSHCVNTRLALEQKDGRRFVKIVKSPCCPNAVVPYKITSAGIEDDTALAT